MDREYWRNYYSEAAGRSLVSSSSFAVFCISKGYIRRDDSVVELGCGSGRDAIYFCENGVSVVAIDQSVALIENKKDALSKQARKLLVTEEADFVQKDFSDISPVKIFYSRFTLHSISREDEDILIPKIYNSLGNEGLFCVECRTVKDPLYGVGKYCGDDTYATDHRRRFINSGVFLDKVLALGFNLVYFTEEAGLSIHLDDNPVLMRIILRK